MSILPPLKWKPSAFLRYVKSFETTSLPVLIVTDQGDAVLKAKNNPEGVQVLFCEWLGTRLAQCLQIRTFDIAVLNLERDDEIPLGKQLVEIGSCFIARYERGGPFNGPSLISAMDNPMDIVRVVLLDTWLRNCDRYRETNLRINRDNLFLSEEGAPPGKFTMKAIDHGHILTCGREITQKVTEIGIVKEAQLYGLFPEFETYLRDCFQKDPDAIKEVIRLSLKGLRSIVSGKIWDDTIEEIPSEWLPKSAVVMAIKQFLKDRAEYLLEEFIGLLQPKLFPDELDFRELMEDENG